MTVKEIREYLKEKKSVIVPVGVIEQHGYHLPLKTDALIADHIGRLVGLKTGILRTPVMYQSFSGGECPGTINISPATMSLVISDMLTSLASQGFKNIYILLCHGGSENASALDNALKLLLRTNPAFKDIMVALMPIWKFASKDKGWKKAIKEGDWHAGWLETSMVMALEPDKVKMNELELDSSEILEQMIKHPDNYQYAEKIVNDECVVPRTGQKDEVKVGVMGYPDTASVELGREIVDDAVESLSRKIEYLDENADGVYKQVNFVPEPLILE